MPANTAASTRFGLRKVQILVSSLIYLYARVNEYGFLEAPYRKVVKEKVGNKTMIRVTNEIVYLTADNEEQYRITYSDIHTDAKGYITDTWLLPLSR